MIPGSGGASHGNPSAPIGAGFGLLWDSAYKSTLNAHLAT
jgi:hypothetical protein